MEHEILEHRKRLDILQKHLKDNYYTIGKYHLAISEAMKEYTEQANGAESKNGKLPIPHVVKSVCIRCGKPVNNFDKDTNNCCDECWLSS